MKIPKKRTQKRHKHTTYHGDRKIKVSPICVNAFMLWIRPLWSRVSGAYLLSPRVPRARKRREGDGVSPSGRPPSRRLG